MPCCLCGSAEHTSPHCRWLNIYRDKYGKFHCSEIGFASAEAARNVGEAHGETYLLSVAVPSDLPKDPTVTVRRSGRTTEQIKKAAAGSIFIWGNDKLDYPSRLAQSIGRKDLQIVSPAWLEHAWRGRHLSGVVVDHAANLSERQVALLAHACARIDWR